jgi:hypothetical protein
MATEKRLIDANELRTQFDDIPPYIGLAGSLVQQYIDKALTVDGVEVVRCKDCIVSYCHGDDDFVCGRSGVNVDPDDFCSYGERKDNG